MTPKVSNDFVERPKTADISNVKTAIINAINKQYAAKSNKITEGNLYLYGTADLTQVLKKIHQKNL